MQNDLCAMLFIYLYIKINKEISLEGLIHTVVCKRYLISIKKINKEREVLK